MSNPMKKAALAKRQQRFTAALLKQHHVTVARVGDLQVVIHRKNHRPIVVGRLVQEGINDLRHSWTVFLALVCRDAAGEPSLLQRELSVTHPCYASHLTSVLDRHFEEMEQEAKDEPDISEVLSTAWIALPYETEVTEREAFQIFERFNAWEQPNEESA